MPTAMPRASSYHVAFEAALLLRIVQVPAEQRVNLTEKRDAREKVVAQVEKMFKGSIGLAQARKAGLRFYDGLMLQLRGLQAAVLQLAARHMSSETVMRQPAVCCGVVVAVGRRW